MRTRETTMNSKLVNVDHLFLNVFPTIDVKKFGIHRKISPNFMGPSEIIERRVTTRIML